MSCFTGRSLLFLALAFIGPAGCQRDPLAGPPEIRLGSDECAECGMIINESRCSSALLIESEGEQRHLLFDDLGCMLDYEHEHGHEHATIDRFVRDYSADGWAQAERAFYLSADPDTLPTPMGSGLAAVGDADSAERLRSEVNGRIMTYAQAAAARRQWKQARLGSQDDAAPSEASDD